jgi:hypothetical protein
MIKPIVHMLHCAVLVASDCSWQELPAAHSFQAAAHRIQADPLEMVCWKFLRTTGVIF